MPSPYRFLYAQWRRFGFWRASLATGPVWAVWHWPLMILFGFNLAPGHSASSLLLVTLQTILLAPSLTLMRDGGRSMGAGPPLRREQHRDTARSLALGAPAFPWDCAAMIGAAGLGAALVAAFQRAAINARVDVTA